MSKLYFQEFYDKTYRHILPSGASCIMGDTAVQQAERFVNRKGIKYVDMKYTDNKVLLIYRKEKIDK